jgi:hypothetical protein
MAAATLFTNLWRVMLRENSHCWICDRDLSSLFGKLALKTIYAKFDAKKMHRDCHQNLADYKDQAGRLYA